MDVIELVGVVTMGVVVVEVVSVVVVSVGVVSVGVVSVGVVSVMMLAEFVAVSVPNTVVTVFAGNAAISVWPAAPVNTKPLIS